jgi:hypothetical protein
MTDALTYTTTKAFTAEFKDVKELARSGAVVELHERGEVFLFQRKPGTGGFFGALQGKVKERAPLEQLFSADEAWEGEK